MSVATRIIGGTVGSHAESALKTAVRVIFQFFFQFHDRHSLVLADNEADTVRVLIVEDDKKVAGVVRRGLESEGFGVDIALNGPDGLWMASEGSYDVIVLDIMLPGMNGFKVCENLRGAGNWTPILMLTAKDGEYDHAEALDTGADDYLTKPFSFVVLRET